MKEARNNWKRRLRAYFGKDADSVGITLQEILIGIAIAGVLAAASIIAGVTFIGRGQAASARTTLQNAVLASEAVYARILPGGERNWTGAVIASGATDDELSRAAASALSELDEPFEFIPVGAAGYCSDSTHTTQTACVSPATWTVVSPVVTNINDINSLTGNQIWVYVDVAQAGVAPAGQTLRMGLKGPDGSTLCVISVKRSSGTGTTGRGWQAVNEDSSTLAQTVPTPLVAGLRAADCGAWGANAAAKAMEIPGTGTDTSLGEPIATTLANYAS